MNSSDRRKADALALIQFKTALSVLEGTVNYFERSFPGGDQERAVAARMANRAMEFIRQGRSSIVEIVELSDTAMAQHNEMGDADI